MHHAKGVARNTMIVDTTLDCEMFEKVLNATHSPLGVIPLVYPRRTVKNKAFLYNGINVNIYSGYKLTKAGAVLFMLAFHECIVVHRAETLKRLEGIIRFGYGNIICRGKDYCFSDIFDCDVNITNEHWFLFANKMKQRFGELAVPKVFQSLRSFDQAECSKAMVYLIHICDLASRLGYSAMKKLYQTLEFDDINICPSLF